MTHFATGILACLAVGGLAAPVQDTNNDTTVESTAAMGDATVAEGPAPIQSTLLSIFNLGADATSAALTTGVTTYLPSTSAPVIAAAIPTGGVDLTRLFGKDERPDIRHLEAVGEAIKDDSKMELKNNLTQISTLLLALTKIDPEGNWIKSMFDLPGHAGSVYEGPDVVNITLATLNTTQDWKYPTVDENIQKSIRIEKGKLDRLKELGVSSDQITEPWWPYALIEGVLEIRSGLGKPTYWDTHNMYHLLKILTGNNKANYWFYSGQPNSSSDSEVKGIIEHANISPVIYRPVSHSEEPAPWTVMMRPPFKDANNEEQIGWARPFATSDNNHVKEFNSYSPSGDIEFSEIIYIEDPVLFEKRPDFLNKD